MEIDIDMEDRIAKLYTTFVNNGYDMESEEEFRANLGSPAKRRAAYDALVSDDYDMEPFEEFEKNLGFGMDAAASVRDTATGRKGPNPFAKVSTIEDAEERGQLKPSAPAAAVANTTPAEERAQGEAESKAAGTEAGSLGVASTDASQGVTESSTPSTTETAWHPDPDELARDMGNIKAVATQMQGSVDRTKTLIENQWDALSPRKKTTMYYDEESGKTKRGVIGRDGIVYDSAISATYADTPTRQRKLEMDVEQGDVDIRDYATSEAARMFAEANTKARKEVEAYNKGMSGAGVYAAPIKLMSVGEIIARECDPQKVAEKLIGNLPWDAEARRAARKIREGNPDITPEELEAAVGEYLDKRCQEIAEDVWSKAQNDARAALKGKELFAKMLYSTLLGTYLQSSALKDEGAQGMAPFFSALEEWGKEHPILNGIGMAGGMALSPETYLGGWLGSSAGRLVLGGAGRLALGKGIGLGVAANMMTKLPTWGARIARGGAAMASGAANFATFETAHEVARQVGADDFSAGEILKTAGHGALLGAVTGGTGKLAARATAETVGRVSGEAAKALAKAVGKSGEFGVEGLTFGTMDWLLQEPDEEGNVKSYAESLEDAYAMIAGMKLAGAAKSVPGALGKMATDYKRGAAKGGNVEQRMKIFGAELAAIDDIRDLAGRVEGDTSRGSLVGELAVDLGRIGYARAREGVKGVFEGIKRRMAEHEDAYLTTEEYELLKECGYGDVAAMLSKEAVEIGVTYAEEGVGIDLESGEIIFNDRRPDGGLYVDKVSMSSAGMEKMKALVADKRIPAELRSRWAYALYGVGTSLPTPMRWNVTDTDGKEWTVESYDTEGYVIERKKFRSQRQADAYAEGVRQRAEMGGLGRCEELKDELASVERFATAAGIVANRFKDKHKDKRLNGEAVANIYNHWAVRRGEAPADVVEVLDAVEAEYDNLAEVFASRSADGIRKSVESEQGVDLSEVLAKRPSERSEIEQGALEEYVKRLLPDQGEAPRVWRGKLLTGGDEVFVVNGEVGLGRDGEVDKANSDPTIVVYNVQRGKVEMVPAEELSEMRDATPAPPAPDAETPVEVEGDGEAPGERVGETPAGRQGVDKPAIDFEQEREIRFADEKGDEAQGYLTGYRDPETGKIEYYKAGERRMRYATDEELRDMVKDFKPIMSQAEEGTVETEPVTAPAEDGANNISIPKDRKGNDLVEGDRVGYENREGSMISGTVVGVDEQGRVRVRWDNYEYGERSNGYHTLDAERDLPYLEKGEFGAPTAENAMQPVEIEATSATPAVPDGMTADRTIGVAQNDGSIRQYTVAKDQSGNQYVVDEQGFMWGHDGNGENIKPYRPGENVSEWTDEQINRLSVQPSDAASEVPAAPAATEQPAEATVEPMPIDKEGEPQFMQVTPERGHAYIFGESGLDRTKGRQFVKNNINTAKTNLDKLKKKEPTIGTSIAKYNKQMAEWQQKLGEAQQALDYWNSVSDVQSRIEAAEAAERQRIQAEQTEAAIARYEAEKAAAAQAEAERQAVGYENAMPVISERYNAAPKIYGNEDVLTLPNGEQVKGRWVLSTPDATTPSHDPFNGYVQSEGFPRNPNGTTVNDRDYERDLSAQRANQDKAAAYDGRAIQNPIINSMEGVVMSGNDRDMAGKLAAAGDTDAKYMEYLTNYGAAAHGFTPEQVASIPHARLRFELSEPMEYTTENFAKFNAQEMKSQSNTETAVKMGKVVDDGTFKGIVRSISSFDTLGDFYNNQKAGHDAIGALLTGGVVGREKLPELLEGPKGQEKLTEQGKKLLEAVLIGKFFEKDPEAVRILTEHPSMRQRVVYALSELADNFNLGKDYSLEEEMISAAKLCGEALSDRGQNLQVGDIVSYYGRQGVLFEEYDLTDQYKQYTVMMLADLLNHKNVSELKKVVTLYDSEARQSAAGQLDLFTGGVRTREDIIKDVLNNLKYGSKQEIEEAQRAAIERRKSSVSEDGTVEPGDAESPGSTGNDSKNQENSLGRTGDRGEIDDWFGPIYDNFQGKGKEAEQYLREQCEGVAKGALTYPGVSPIDLAWGDMNAGYMKIVIKHPEVVGRLQEILDECKITNHSDNRIVFESDTHKIVVSKKKGNIATDNWLLTAYEKKEKPVSASSSDIETEPKGKQNGTATLQNELTSDGKDSDFAGDKQGEAGKSSVQKSIDGETEQAIAPNAKPSKGDFFVSKRTGEVVYVGQITESGAYRLFSEHTAGVKTLSELYEMFRPATEEDIATSDWATKTWKSMRENASEWGLEEKGKPVQSAVAAASAEGDSAESSESEVSKRFDEQLERQAAEGFKEGDVYRLGKPSAKLVAAGFPSEQPMEMSAAKLDEKSRQRNHPFDIRSLKGLVVALRNPLAVFPHGDGKKALNAIVELKHGDDNFLIGVHFNREKDGKMIASVRGVFPKYNTEWLKWIENGTAIGVDRARLMPIVEGMREILSDKEKTERYMSNRSTSGDLTEVNLDLVAKIINDFGKNNGEIVFDEIENDSTVRFREREGEEPKKDIDWRERGKAKRETAERLSEAWGAGVKVVGSVEELRQTEAWKKADAQTRKQMEEAKGWYDHATGELVVVAENNRDADDVISTMLHEGVAHMGMDRLLGGAKAAREFYGDVYGHLGEAERGKVNATLGDNGWDAAKATEEYFGRLAENPEAMDMTDMGAWARLKARVQSWIATKLGKAGIKMPRWMTLGDNELRYMLWRSKRNLERGGKRDYVDMAEDIAMRTDLRVGSDVSFRNPGETDDIWQDHSVGLHERMTNAAVRLAGNNAADLTLKTDAMRAIGGNLTNLRKAMSAQRKYDITTVKRVSDLARILMENGYLDGLNGNEVRSLLSAIKSAVGKQDISNEVQRVMDIMVEVQLKNGQATLAKMLSIKGSKVNAQGVEVQGELDPDGARTMKVMKKAMTLTEDEINDRIDEAMDRMGNADVTIADEAAIEYSGLQLALEYVQNITQSKAEEKALRDELKKAKEDKDAGQMTADSYRQFAATTADAIRQNKIDRAEAYNALAGRMADSLRDSIENAKAFREREKQRIGEIHHNANSDMEGRPNNEHHKDTRKDKLANNGLIQFVFAPLATFDQMLRVFGNKSASGEGYLWNRFMRGWIDGRNKEITGVKNKFKILDDKAAEIFGHGYNWGKLIRKEGSLPMATVRFWDGGEMRDHKLTQGNLMYIYMVDKMTDGQMKLRKMGITEEDVEDITNVLDPRLRQLADWLQDEFLVETRNEYNEVHKRMFGTSMAAIDNYFPLKILANARADKEEDVNGQTQQPGISTKTGSIIKRRRNALALDLTGADALNVILDHITEMEHWAAFVEWQRDINTLRTYKRFRNQVLNMTTVYGGGRVLWDKFNDVCQMAAGTYRPPVANLDKAAVNFAKGVTAAKVSFRVFTALKQLLSAPAYIPEARVHHLLMGVANPYGAWKWCLDELPIFRERWQSRMSGDPRLLKSDMDWKLWRQRWMQIASRIGMSPNAFVDATTVAIGAHAMYKSKLQNYLKEGFERSEAEMRAKQDATILFNQTQQSNESPFMSTMQVDRSWLSVLFTVFRNSAMSYTRQFYDATRNLKRNLTPGQRAASVAFMAKQLEREGLGAAEARRAAGKRFNRQLKRDLMRVATFGFVLQLAWNLGAYLPYIFFGDDEDEKGKMWDDAFTHAYYGSVEGLTGGDVMSAFGNMATTGEWNRNALTKDMPIASDINTILQKFTSGKDGEAVNDIINLLVQSGLGFNPQSLTDTALAIMDRCGNDPAIAKEATLMWMRILQVPQSQIDKIYFDEIGLSGAEASKLTPEQIAERYARYKVKRGSFIEPWMWDNAALLDKYKDTAKKRIKERLAKQGDKDVNEQYLEYEEIYKGVDAQMKAYNKAKKTDYVRAAEIASAIQDDPESYRIYECFKFADKQLDALTKYYLKSETAEEAAILYEAILTVKAYMIEAINTEDEAERDAIGDKIDAYMEEVGRKFEAMHSNR